MTSRPRDSGSAVMAKAPGRELEVSTWERLTVGAKGEGRRGGKQLPLGTCHRPSATATATVAGTPRRLCSLQQPTRVTLSRSSTHLGPAFSSAGPPEFLSHPLCPGVMPQCPPPPRLPWEGSRVPTLMLCDETSVGVGTWGFIEGTSLLSQ